MTALTLHLHQASSAHGLSNGQAAVDFLEALDRRADVVSFTEAKGRHYQLQVACDLRGYRLLLPKAGDVALAVLNIHKVTAHGEQLVNAAVPHGAGSPAHTARTILWATITPFGTSEDVTVHTAHWVTRRADAGHQQLQLTRELADQVAGHSRWATVAFWMGDTNSPDRPHDVNAVDRVLAKGQLTSCWDELGLYPDTHGRATIDVIGSYDRDGRVRCLRARRWPAGFSDHRPVSAWYSIRPPRRPGAARRGQDTAPDRTDDPLSGQS